MNETRILVIYDDCEASLKLYSVPSYHTDILILRSCNGLYVNSHEVTDEQLTIFEKLSDGTTDYETYDGEYLISEVIITGWVP